MLPSNEPVSFEEFFDSRTYESVTNIVFLNQFVINIIEINQKSVLSVSIGETSKIFMLHQLENAARWLYENWYAKEFAL